MIKSSDSTGINIINRRSRSYQVLLILPILPKVNDAKPPANPPIIILMGCPYIFQKASNASLALSGGITFIVKFAGLVI